MNLCDLLCVSALALVEGLLQSLRIIVYISIYLGISRRSLILGNCKRLERLSVVNLFGSIPYYISST